jgi:hypothetical protein
MSLKRKSAVDEGRAMVRVRTIDTHDLATIGVCPGCWNIKERREVLLIKLKKMKLEVVHKDDMLSGIYRPGKSHAPGCPHGEKSTDPWNNFSDAIRAIRRCRK